LIKLKKIRLSVRLVLAGVVLLCCWPFPYCAGASALAKSSYVWLENGEQYSEDDGSVTQIVYIKSGEGINIADLQDVNAFYCDERQQGEKKYYKLPVDKREDRYYLRITTPTRARCLVYFTAKQREEQLVAQMSLYLYGRGTPNKKSEPILLKRPAVVPSLALQSSGNIMRPQTGQKLQIVYTSADDKTGVLNEMEITDLKIKSTEKLLPNDTGLFVFIPPHDQLLNSGGNSAYKELIVYAEETDGAKVYKTSMNILLRRSSSAFRNMPHGIILFCSTLLATLAAVLYRRRSLPY